MDPNLNPFAPGAGYRPPALVGRDHILEKANLTLNRIKNGKPAKGFVLIGLRGVGKTVLLNHVEESAESLGFQSVMIESVDDKRLVAMLVPALRKLLFRLDRMEGIGDKVKYSFRVLRSFVSAVKVNVGELEFGIDVAPERGSADSGDLEADLPELLIAIGQAAASRNTAVALIIDEMQYLLPADLSALIVAMHRIAQKQLPITLIGAGLPPLLRKMGDARSYTERLFDYPNVGALDRAGVREAVLVPVEDAGAYIDKQAIDLIFNITKGYPYFVQEWGHHAWNATKGKNIEVRFVQNATSAAWRSLDEGFFSVRFDRLTPAERDYLRAMAHFQSEAVKSGKIAAALGKSVQSVASVKGDLIKKGMVYSPAYGDAAFTVPLFDSFMRRRMPDWTSKG